METQNSIFIGYHDGSPYIGGRIYIQAFDLYKHQENKPSDETNYRIERGEENEIYFYFPEIAGISFAKKYLDDGRISVINAAYGRLLQEYRHYGGTLDGLYLRYICSPKITLDKSK